MDDNSFGNNCVKFFPTASALAIGLAFVEEAKHNHSLRRHGPGRHRPPSPQSSPPFGGRGGE